MIASSIERFEFFAFTIQNAVVDVAPNGVDATGRLYICELRQERDGHRLDDGLRAVPRHLPQGRRSLDVRDPRLLVARPWRPRPRDGGLRHPGPLTGTAAHETDRGVDAPSHGRLDPMEPVVEITPGRAASVGGATVQRALPVRAHRTIGAWCFLDHFGPQTVTPATATMVGPHPHLGLQTVTWLLDGELVHTDSLGTEQPIPPGSST